MRWPTPLTLAGFLVLSLGASAPARALMDPVVDWSHVGAADQNLYGFVTATAGDVNGDGYSDLLVSEPGFNGAFSACGRVYVYHGGPNGPAALESWKYTGSMVDGFLGRSASFAGDVNGDGYDDIIVGEAGYNAATGRIFIFHGSASGLGLSPARTLTGTVSGGEFGASVSGAGDLNGDGYADVAIGEPRFANGQADEGRVSVYFGSATGINALPDWTKEANAAGRQFGTVVAPAGDVEGDGYDDLLVTQLGDNSSVPSVLMFHGTVVSLPSFATWTALALEGSYPTVSVATAGDINGDGYADVLVGDMNYTDGVTEPGRARLFYGSSTGLAPTAGWQDLGMKDLGGFGHLVGTAGDMNGDGFADFFVGGPTEANTAPAQGTVHVYFGGAGGPTVAISNGLLDYLMGMNYGLSGMTGGDVNGDGFSDLFISDIGFTTVAGEIGAVYLYYGGGAGVASSAIWQDQGDLAGAAFGGATALGDWNGDGHSDLAVSATGVPGLSGGHGAVYLYYGTDAGLPTSPSNTIHENGSLTYFGWALANAGDVNGDGFDDLLVGANTFFGITKAYVYYGGLLGVDNTADWSHSGNTAGDLFGTAVASAGDVNGDGYCDILVGARNAAPTLAGQGAAYAFYGSSTGPSSTPNWTKTGGQASAGFGAALSGAGDVNADGYSDVIIGSPDESNGQAGEGFARIYLGSAAGLSTLTPWTKEGNQAGAAFGAAVSGAGDVDGDGISDVIVGAPKYDNGHVDEGRVYVYRGLAPNPLWTGEPNSAGAQLGFRVADGGDVNGDGHSDPLAGAYSMQVLFGSGAGQAFLYDGAGGSSGTLLSILAGAQPNEHFGYAIAGNGDVNGDGFSDVVVGAPDWDGALNGQGQAKLYLGNEGDGLDRERRQYPATGITAPLALYNASPMEDRFKISVTARTTKGRGRVRLEYCTQPAGGVWGAILRDAGWFNTGAPVLSGGSRAGASAVVAGLAPDSPWAWRVRVASDLPLFPHTPWLNEIGNAAREVDLRTGPAASGVAERPAVDALLRARVTPNPFRAGMAISFALPVAGPVAITLFDVQGRRVAGLGADWLDAGERTLRWNGRDDAGAPVAGGVYFVRLETPAGWTARKVLKVE